MAHNRKGYPNLAHIQDERLRQTLQAILDKLAATESMASTNPLDSSLTGRLRGGGHRLSEIADPVKPQDAVTMKYLHAFIASRLSDQGVLQPVPPPIPAPGAGGGGQPGPNPPIGPSRGNSRCFMDDGGNFLACGASLFWGLWGFINERDRLAQNLNVMRNGGIQYIRCLGTVGPEGWSNRTITVQMAEQFAGVFTDWVFDNFDMRVQWTIFGGGSVTPNSTVRANLINTFLGHAAGRENKIFAFETFNEPEGKVDLAELRTLTTNLQNGTSVLVAAGSSSGAGCGGAYGAQAIYAAPVGDFVTSHFDRNVTGTCGIWRPVRQPWEQQFCGGIPILTSNNEPIGPQSSVAADDDPLRLAMQAAVSYIAGVGAYVLHTGAGIRGGGTEDLNVGRVANIYDYGNIDTIFQALRNVRNILPTDVPNWSKHNTNNNYPNRPWDLNPGDSIDTGRLCRLYNASSGNQFCSAMLGITQPFNLVARFNMSRVDFYDVVGGGVMVSRSFGVGEEMGIGTVPPGMIIRGEYA